nr:hypothetical protein [Chlamydiota bacterium]
ENELGNCASVSKAWCQVAYHILASRTPSIAFGRTQWETYFGDIGEEEPPLPGNIWQILKSPCPFWPEKRVKQTHLLVLIPASVNDEPLTLESLGDLVQNPQNGGHASKYDLLDLSNKLRQESGKQSYWVLMTRDVLPDTRNKSYERQKEKVAEHEGYVVSKAREAAVCLFMHHVSTKEQLYGHEPWTFTLCEELVRKQFPAAVGGFGPGGLDVGSSHFVDDVGMGALRKLS